MSTRRPTRDRHSIRRLHQHDYAARGTYLVTLCTRYRNPLFGQVMQGRVCPTDIGRMIAAEWAALPDRFPFVRLDAYMVMPDHIDGIVTLSGAGHAAPDPAHERCAQAAPLGGGRGDSLARVIQTFKLVTTNRYIEAVCDGQRTPLPDRLWQRDHYESIIRNERGLERVRRYIRENPARWQPRRS